MLLLAAAGRGIGFAMLYSAANGGWDPWASRQMVRFGVGLVHAPRRADRHPVLVPLRLRDLLRRLLILLVAVEVMGRVGMGAQRWIDLGSSSSSPRN